MSNKVKVPGGAFYAGDGLTVDQTTRTVSAGGGSSVSTPDWNQNDATASDYIKNRPFYTETVETVLVEESTVSFAADDSGLYMAQFESTFSATVGETYKVSWDGITYECACIDYSGNIVIGNLSIIGAGSDTGEPFFMLVNNGKGIDIATADASASHTISISGFAQEVVKIDEKYLPDTIATKSDAEAAQSTANAAKTAADNAKVTADNAKATANIADTKAEEAKTAADKANSKIRTEDLWFHSSGAEGSDPNVPYGIKIGSINSLMTNPRIAMTTADGLIMCGDGSNPTERNIEIKVKKESNIPFGYIEAHSGLGYSVTITPTKISAAFADATIKSLDCLNGITLKSSTSGSTKKFRITVDDNGVISATEVTA